MNKVKNVYKAKAEMFSKVNKSELARKLEYTSGWVIRLLNGKVTTNKATALLIVNLVNPAGKFEDYLERKD